MRKTQGCFHVSIDLLLLTISAGALLLQLLYRHANTLAARRLSKQRCLEPHFVNLGKRLVKSPKVTKGFWQACDDLQLDVAYVVAPVADGWVMKAPAQVISVMDIAQKLLA